MAKIWHKEADHIVVGSGAAGATAALALAEAGKSVMILEEGNRFRKEDFSEDLYGTIIHLFRDYGMQTTRGRSVIPVLQGRCVGGSTVLNGAIVHRLPRRAYEVWSKDKALVAEIPYERLDSHASQIEEDLKVGRNLDPVLDSLPVTKTLRELNWSHEAMLRNAPGCQATGRCLQGCPSGGKWSMENSYIPRGEKAGAQLLSGHRVIRVLFERNRAVGVLCQKRNGEKVALRANRSVVLTAGVVHTPQILWKSGLGSALPGLGRHFQCHLSIGIVGLLRDAAEKIQGPPQGIEILQFHGEGVKLATQLLPPEILLARSPLFGDELRELLGQASNLSSWCGSVQSEAEGVIRRSVFGKPIIHYTPSTDDMKRVRYSLYRLGQLLFEMDADRVFPGICGTQSLPLELGRDDGPEGLSHIPLDPRNYLLSVGHLFGGCRIGSDPRVDVVAPDFRVHGLENLYVLDASIFPTNIGVNPQHSIMTLARFGTHRLLAEV